jgi:hypothetical protein
MKKTIILFFLFVGAISGHAVPVRSKTSMVPHKPKLLIAIAIDQFRYDYIMRFCDRCNTTKVIGTSMRDRAAILPSGRIADAAYWIDNQNGNVVSSTWYQAKLPPIFYGSNIRPCVYGDRVGISDVAPTLAAVLEVEMPSGNIGHVLKQVASPFLANRQPKLHEQSAVNQSAHQ